MWFPLSKSIRGNADVRKLSSKYCPESQGASYTRPVNSPSSPSPDLYCVEIQRHPRDLGVTVILAATCELMARREALRLFPGYKHNLVLMQVFLARYAEIDWVSGRTIVVKQGRRPDVPPCVAAGTWCKRPFSNPRNLNFEANDKLGASDEFCHSNSEHLRQAGCRSREREEQRLRVVEFVHSREPIIPGLRDVVEMFRETGNWEETAARIGQRRCSSIRWRVREQGKQSMLESDICIT